MKDYYWLIGLLAISGCSVELDSEKIETQLKQSIALSDSKIAALPVFELTQKYNDGYGVKRDPFRSEMSHDGIDWAAKELTSMPDLTHEKSALEHLDLDSLVISGQIHDQHKDWILVFDPTGNISRVAVGDRIGKHYGEVIELNRDGFVVLEKLMDGHGRWYSHHRAILKDGKNED